MDALAFLDTPGKAKRQPVFVVAGDEEFLRRRCRAAIQTLVLADADPEFALAVYPPEKLDFSTIRNELETLPFLAPCRLVIIESADAFVSLHREALEGYLAKPSRVGVLILEVKTFPETTRLAKQLPDAAKLMCKPLSPYKLPEWCVKWAKTEHQKTLTNDAAAVLVELVEPQLGLLAQELAKLSTAVGAKSTITADAVQSLVSRSRAADVFRIMNAIGDGNPAEALTVLGQLLDAGEEPLAILGPLMFQLRKLATTNRFVASGQSLGAAMDSANVAKWPQARQSLEKQLKHLGRRRLDQLMEWVVELNLGLKGGNPLPPRVQLERLIVRLARPRD